FTDDLVEKQFASATRLGENEKAILRNALAQWEVFAQASGDSAAARAARAEGVFRVANLQRQLGLTAEAEANYRTAMGLCEALAADGDPVARSNVAHCRDNLSNLLHKLNRRRETEEQTAAALAIRERLAAEFPA